MNVTQHGMLSHLGDSCVITTHAEQGMQMEFKHPV